MFTRIKNAYSFFRHFIGLLVGVPDYEKYLSHMKDHHPDRKALTRKEFFDQAQKDRYGGGKMNKCC